MSQRDEAWFKRRAGKFTGSRFTDLMAKTKSGPAASRKNLITCLAIERLTGNCMDTYSNYAMQRGIELEPEALAAYEDNQLVVVESVDFIDHPKLDFVGVSPDGLVDGNGMVEVKCPLAEAKHYEALRFGAHAVEYKWQLQGQLWVSGREWVDAVSYDPRFPDDLALAIVRVERDEKALKELEAECIAADSEVSEQIDWFKQNRRAA